MCWWTFVSAATERDAIVPFGRHGDASDLNMLWKKWTPLSEDIAEAIIDAGPKSMIPSWLGEDELNLPSFTVPTGYRVSGIAPGMPSGSLVLTYHESLYTYAVILCLGSNGKLNLFLPVAGHETASQVQRGLAVTFSKAGPANLTTVVRQHDGERNSSRTVTIDKAWEIDASQPSKWQESDP
jgi:hypothetical protein